MAYKTPGVYVEEISTLPPSVAEVATAIPAFIGYTEKPGQIADGLPVLYVFLPCWNMKESLVLHKIRQV